MIKRFVLTVLWICLLSSCSVPSAVSQDRSVNQPPSESAQSKTAPSPASTDGDFFAAKAQIRHAKAFKVEYHDTYKVVTVLQPWRDAETTFTYILIQRGAVPPEHIGDAQVIEIPLRRIASLSTTHLPYLDAINALDTLTAIGNAEYVNTPGVVERLQSGAIKAVGNGPEVNIEMLLDLAPEAITTLALGNPNKDDYQRLMQKGFKVVVVSDFMEETPLGRAEWVKFMALFYNQEAESERVFAGIQERYEKMRAAAAQITERPTVIMGFEINGKWNMPGGKSYQAAYIQDAGGRYLWEDDNTSGRIPLSFETVFEKGAGADFWLNQSVSWLTAEDVLAADPRYANFAAFNQGRAYNNNARLNATGGNDYNESGHAHPDRILADLIAILHPEILPDHSLVYYRRLKPGGNEN